MELAVGNNKGNSRREDDFHLIHHLFMFMVLAIALRDKLCENLLSVKALFKGVQTFVAMVILVAMHCWTRARPFGVKVEFRASISVIHHARSQCAR